MENEWEAIRDRDPTTFESPIIGLNAETFEAIFDEEMFDATRARGINDNCLAALDTRTVQLQQQA